MRQRLPLLAIGVLVLAAPTTPPRTPQTATTAHTLMVAGRERTSMRSRGRGGHTRPGGRQYLPVNIIGKASRDFDASETIRAFFARHPRP